MHNDDVESIMKQTELARLDTDPLPEGEVTIQEKPALMSAVDYLHYFFSGAIKYPEIPPARTLRSEETSNELKALAEVKRERKNLKRLAQLTK